ncbi:MAG: hypothetical protein ACOY94_05735 [Bacillota bacterium]
MADELRGGLLRALLWAVGAEFLLVRLLSRVGVFIPKSGAVEAGYRGAVWLGEVAFNLSLMLAVVVLALLLRLHRRPLALLAGAAGLLALLGARLPGGAPLAAALLPVAVAALGITAALRAPAALRPGLGLILLAQLLRYAAGGLQLGWVLFDLPGELPGAAWLLRVGELLAVLAPIALGTAALRLTGLRRASLLAVGAPALLAAALLVEPDITAILAMFSLGFTLSWPALLYLLGAGAVVLALSALPSGQRLGLALLLLAGIGLNVNQQHLITLVGWALLALPLSLREEVDGS